ncbi:MAG: hypothetical protein IJ080_02760 [Oscillospiraceae bacterium]|nr:hypothetical protein [Oscillospiraceae bacterium]MBQ8978665.1 hypothetical protein [Oscillospiraceae bacterium]
MNEKKTTLQYDPKIMLREGLPIFIALFAFLASASYIVYRMVSDYNYNARWKDYDECGI